MWYQEWGCSYAVVRVLCEWAVCGARWGEHRAMAAAALLDKRQQQLLHQHHDLHATGNWTLRRQLWHCRAAYSTTDNATYT